MKTKFVYDGASVSVFKMNEDQFSDILNPKIYTVQYSEFQGFYLEVTKDKLELPDKVYGSTPQRVQKCIETYKDRPMSTGILMTGDKGTGKTLLMSLLANAVVQQLELPVILVKDAHSGAKFVSFIESLGECCIVFDEFGKMYTASERNSDMVSQKALLTLMDGVDKTKRMFILTENNEIDISDFMLNRPSRIYYHFKYTKLDEESVTGYCEDHAVKPNILKEIIDLSRRSRIFSFDMLQSIVEEHLRFGTSIADSTSDLNIDIRETQGAMIEIIKILERDTDVERELFETAIMPKPGADGYCYIKIKPNGDARTDNSDRPSAACDIEDDEEHDLYSEIYVEECNLAYEQDGNLVYETAGFTFHAKDVIPATRNYYNIF